MKKITLFIALAVYSFASFGDTVNISVGESCDKQISINKVYSSSIQFTRLFRVSDIRVIETDQRREVETVMHYPVTLVGESNSGMMISRQVFLKLREIGCLVEEANPDYEQ